MPTRYTLELEGLKGVVTNETFTEVTQREEAKKTVKKALEERYSSGKNRWFFTPLRMFAPIKEGRYDMDTDSRNRFLDTTSLRADEMDGVVCVALSIGRYGLPEKTQSGRNDLCSLDTCCN